MKVFTAQIGIDDGEVIQDDAEFCSGAREVIQRGLNTDMFSGGLFVTDVQVSARDVQAERDALAKLTEQLYKRLADARDKSYEGAPEEVLASAVVSRLIETQASTQASNETMHALICAKQCSEWLEKRTARIAQDNAGGVTG